MSIRTWVTALVAIVAPQFASAQGPNRYQGSMAQDMLTLSDTQSSRPIIRPNLRRVINDTPLIPQVVYQGVPGGFDLRVSYTNHGSAPAPLGSIVIPGIRMAQRVNVRHLLSDSGTQSIDHNNQAYYGFGYTYPKIVYSPVFAFDDGAVCMGLSLLYPILEYKHDVQLQLTSPNAPHDVGGRNWEIWVRLLGNLGPGQSRTYTLCARFTDNRNEWIRTLAPYRDYFRALYGGVQYQRDARPVSGLSLNDPQCLSAQSPIGFCGPAHTRPDIAGWGPHVAMFRNRPNQGYNRFMFWKPSGIFRNHQDLNFPFQFMTHMNEVPAMRDSIGALRTIPSPNLAAGYWWGNSQAFMRGWDTGHAETLNLDNPEHEAAALAELDMAVSLGTTIIGLDAFSGMPDWDGYAWLQRMRQRAPHVKFVVERESGAPDIMHALGPTWVYGHAVKTEKVLADFLLPGHETWGGVMWNELERIKGGPLNAAERLAEINRVAALGYIPVIFDDYKIEAGMHSAAETWRTTIPADLQPGAGGGGGGGELMPPALPGTAPQASGGGGGGGGGGSGVSGTWGGGGGGAMSMGSVAGSGAAPGIATFRNDRPGPLPRSSANIFSSEEIRLAILRARGRVTSTATAHASNDD